jgi:hypothetical protein
VKRIQIERKQKVSLQEISREHLQGVGKPVIMSVSQSSSRTPRKIGGHCRNGRLSFLRPPTGRISPPFGWGSGVAL